jgi:SAM-dependent methyltransferase
MIKLINPLNKQELILDSKKKIYRDQNNNKFPIINNIPRFVNSKNYALNFGFQWNNFRETQIDNGDFNLSTIRFFAETNKKKEYFDKKKILEVGSGAGRFSNVILNKTNAELYSVDLSSAVEANLKNNIKFLNKKFFIFQSDIYSLPFEKNTFDFVFCFGVLQHTPDIKKAIKILIEKTKINGEINVDFYPIKGWYTKIHAKYFFRPITNKISNHLLLKIIKKNVNWLMKLYILLKKIKLGFLTRFLPICDFDTKIISSLDHEKLKEWVILDTFDQYSTKYDNPQKIVNIRNLFEEFGAEVNFAGMVKFDDHEAAVVRAIKK